MQENKAFHEISQFRLNFSQGNKTVDDPTYMEVNLLKGHQKERSDFSVCEEFENIMQLSEQDQQQPSIEGHE